MNLLTTYNIQHTMTSMIRTQVYLPDELFHQAKARAVATNSTISQLIRDGLTFALTNQRAQMKETVGQFLLKRFAGQGVGKKGVEAATNHDDIYELSK